jgi:uncharacterized coiled-coil DUF342 family protein
MAKTTRTTEFRIETYEHLTTIAKARLTAINKSVEDLIEKTTPLTKIQEKSLLGYLKEINTKKEDYDGNLQRVLSGSFDQTFDIDKLISDQNEINELFIHISSCIESLISSSSETNKPTSEGVNNA